MAIQFTTQRLVIAVTAIGVAVFVWLLVDYQMLRQGGVVRRDFAAEMFMLVPVGMRPLSVLVATIALLGLERGLKVGISIISLLVVVCWLVGFAHYT